MNERLKNAMSVAGIDLDAIVKDTHVDPKTVQRWINGRVPHARHRLKLARLLREREEFLWPPEKDTAKTATCTSEIVAAYAHRADVFPSSWSKLFLNATERIDLLGYAMLFLPEQNAGFVELLRKKALAGCKIRIAIADPTCNLVQMRDEEEQLGGTLPARIQTTLYHFRHISNHENIEIRFHTTVLYNSVFRGDEEMFVTPHLYGLHGSKAPLFHLRSLGTMGIFANFAAHFDAVWLTTKREEG